MTNLDTYLSLFERGEYVRFIAIVKAKQLVLDKDLTEKLALAHFHTENYEESTSLLETLCQNSDDAVVWFNFANSAIMNKDLRKGLYALEIALKHNTETRTDGEGIPPVFMLLYTAKTMVNAGTYDSAFDVLERLSYIYIQHKNTNDSYLYENALPLFDEFILLSKDILPKQNKVNPRLWLETIANQLDNKAKIKLESLTKSLFL